MARIDIRDVSPRDGLQSESPVSAARRVQLAVALADAGVANVEAASFVSPKAVPSMAGADEVFSTLPQRSDTTWWALVPNARGAELALDAGVQHLTVTVSASDAYSRKNVGRSTDEATAALAEIADVAGAAAMVDVVVSCAFGSPFDDVTDAMPVCEIVGRVGNGAPSGTTHARRHHRHCHAASHRTGRRRHRHGATIRSRAAPARHARHRARQRHGRDRPRASPASTPPRAGWAGRHSRPVPEATSPPRIWSSCCTISATPPASISKRSSPSPASYPR